MRSRPQDDSLLASERRPAALPPPHELRAIAAIWKSVRRELTARFDGGSMLPTIAPLQEVAIRCGVEPRAGDVVLALASDIVIVHRVMWRSPDGSWLITRGDASRLPDPPIAVADVIGVVDAPPYAARTSQHILGTIVRATALAGRHAVHAAVRILQTPGRLRDALRWRRIGESHV